MLKGWNEMTLSTKTHRYDHNLSHKLTVLIKSMTILQAELRLSILVSSNL